MNSVIVDGKVLDFRYKRMQSFQYAFYIGDIYIGQVYKMKHNSWSSISALPIGMNVAGFKSRYYASEYLLKLAGYWR